jgi:precorrin-2 dehydrogenase / sirohydrochlorin ferrochelatase
MIPIVVDPKQSAMALIGRGEAAERRLELLLAGGAQQIAVFSDAPSQHLAELAAHRLRRRLPSAAELARFALVWIADLPISQAAPLARAGRAGGCLVNVEDVVAFCDFHNPSQVRRGDLLLTVSTAGKSPGLAARVRARLARAFGPEWAERLDRIGEKRTAWRREARSLQELARLTNATIDANGWLPRDAAPEDLRP